MSCRIAIAAGAALLMAGCHDTSDTGAVAEAGARRLPLGAFLDGSATSPAASASVPPSPSVAEPASAPLKRCRVMASEGGPNASADATTWLDLAAGANFTVRTLETGRELRFEGPGRIRACGDEVALLAEGSAVGLPGSGEAPGAEQWAAAACGVVRWASGVHRLTGGHDECRFQASLGTAFLWVDDDVTADDVAYDAGAPMHDAAPDAAAATARASASPSPAPPAAPSASTTDAGASKGGWRRIDARRALRLRGRGALGAPAAVKSALIGCERAAKDVQDLATQMTPREGGTVPADVGELAARSVSARGVARAACAVAAVRIAIGGAKPEDQTRLDAASARWRESR